ncbi:MAG: hypothetical protein Q8R10_19630 [Pseudomonas sp.]|uniref:hypothetical protein n=1 Tax=Pseudomonas sp. TaxID=306 RepID=UPI0027375231|nr:hypothetical protein [Pseudomonas sp.]MDP3848636.1 hypothetical protein [Pseudomonas sp.]
MLLGGSPLNSTPLNGLISAPPFVLTPIAAGLAFRWRLRALVNGADVSARLTGSVSVDRERGAAGVASLVLQLAPGPVVPADWVGRTVVIYYISSAAGITTESLRYSGRIVKTDWNALLRQLSCQCGDQLQQRGEALTIEQIDMLTAGTFWSPDVFDPVAGRSRWDYLQERMSSIPASLDSAADGTLRVSSWYAGAPDFEFGPNTTIYDSLSVSYADLTSLTNTVEVEASYRFSRLWQWNITYGWSHPGRGGLEGEQGFCVWRRDSTELPTVDMIESAAQNGGATMLSASYSPLPPTGVYCLPPMAWINNYYPSLLLGASWVAGRRWVQSVTERYALSVIAEASVAQAGAVIARDSVTVDASRADADEWAGADFAGSVGGEIGGSTGGGGAGVGSSGGSPGGGDTTGLAPGDLTDEPRRASAITCLLNQAATTIIAAHTATQISWDAPTSMVMGVDLIHTLKLDDQGVKAQAKCSRIADEFDLLAGTAITTLSIAVMRGGGVVSDALRPPAYVTPAQPDLGAGPLGSNALPSQLGGRNASPIYDDEKDGFAGNYGEDDTDINAGLVLFPRRFTATVPEIPAIARDEQQTEHAAIYRVAIPNDLLEL